MAVSLRTIRRRVEDRRNGLLEIAPRQKHWQSVQLVADSLRRSRVNFVLEYGQHNNCFIVIRGESRPVYTVRFNERGKPLLTTAMRASAENTPVYVVDSQSGACYELTLTRQHRVNGTQVVQRDYLLTRML